VGITFMLIPSGTSDNSWLGLLVTGGVAVVGAYSLIGSVLPRGRTRDVWAFGVTILFIISGTFALALLGFWALTVDAMDANGNSMRSRFQLGFAILAIAYAIGWVLVTRDRATRGDRPARSADC
jgi:hypothetical protein